MKSIRNITAALAVIVAIGAATPAIAAWGNLRFDMKDPTDSFYIDTEVGNRATSTYSLLGGRQNDHGTAWYHVAAGLRAQPLGDGSGNMTLSLDPTTVGIMEWNGAPALFSSTTNAINSKLSISAFEAYVAGMSEIQPQVQADWNATSGVSFIQNKPTRAFSTSTRSLNSAFQISTTRDSFVSYSVDVAASLSLTGGQTGTVYLEYADNSGFTTNVVTVQSAANGNTGTLTVGLALTQTSTASLTGQIPAGKYVRIRTANTAGTPTFTYRAGQEVLQ